MGGRMMREQGTAGGMYDLGRAKRDTERKRETECKVILSHF